MRTIDARRSSSKTVAAVTFAEAVAAVRTFAEAVVVVVVAVAVVVAKMCSWTEEELADWPQPCIDGRLLNGTLAVPQASRRRDW